jgi:hypothetical protein
MLAIRSGARLSNEWRQMAKNKITKVAAALGLLLILVAAQGPIRAQDQSPDSGLRSVSGSVLDKNEDPLPDAIVYLQNVRTLTVKTYISSEHGEYRFSGLDPNVDYEIHAERDDMTSANHTISSFDSRKVINVTLKIDKQKKAKNK